MPNSVNLLMLNDIKGMNDKKLTKNKQIYQLKNIDDDKYSLEPFSMLVLKGNLNEFLSQNRIVLCYIADEEDLELKNLFGSLFKTYDKNEEGYYTMQPNSPTIKKSIKRNFRK